MEKQDLMEHRTTAERASSVASPLESSSLKLEGDEKGTPRHSSGVAAIRAGVVGIWNRCFAGLKISGSKDLTAGSESVGLGIKRFSVRPERESAKGLLFSEDTQRLLGELQTNRQQLVGLTTEVEQAFLEIGSALERLPDISHSLVNRSERLLALASGQEGGEELLQQVVGSITPSLSYVSHYSDNLIQFVDHLRHLQSRIDHMIDCQGNLERSVAPLKFIRTLFKVESAGLSHELQLMFSGLTEEIDKLQHQVSTSFAAKFGVLLDNRKALGELIQLFEQHQASLGNKVIRKSEELNELLATLKLNLESNKTKDISLRTITKSVHTAVGKMVMNLQTQDIISQRVAHILQSFDAMASRQAKLESSVDPKQAEADLLFLDEAARVEAAQLRDTRVQLQSAEQAMVEAIGNIQSNVDQVGSQCVTLHEFDQVTTSSDGLVSMLLETLDEVRQMVQATIDNSVSTLAEAERIRDQTAHVTATIQQLRILSAQIRMIAINSQVQAALSGKGTGLEVLAASMANIAAETCGTSEHIGSELELFTSEISQLVESSTALRDEGRTKSVDWDADRDAQTSRLHGYRDETLVELTKVGELSESIRSLASQMSRKVHIAAIADRPINAAVQTLDSIHDILGPKASQLALSAGHAVQSEFQRTYTMESEKVIHERAKAGASGNSIPPAAAAATVAAAPIAGASEDASKRETTPTEALGDNVELF